MKLVILGLITLITTIALSLYFIKKIPDHKKNTIAIVMTLSHPALERVRSGFIEIVKNENADIDILEYNAEGNLQQAHLIAHKIANDSSISGVFAIGTLAAQTVAKVEKKRPIVIAAVTDPDSVLPDVADNICGLSDTIDPDFQFGVIRKLVSDIKSVSLLYSPHEQNSASMVKNLLKAAEKHHLKINAVGVNEPQQIMPGSILACQKSDAVLIPLDNQLVAAMPAVVKATKALPCPIITSNESPIHQGAAIAFGVDYEKSGKTAGAIMKQIIEGRVDVKKVGFINPKSIDIFINDSITHEKALKLNAEAVEHAIHVKGEV